MLIQTVAAGASGNAKCLHLGTLFLFYFNPRPACCVVESTAAFVDSTLQQLPGEKMLLLSSGNPFAHGVSNGYLFRRG